MIAGRGGPNHGSNRGGNQHGRMNERLGSRSEPAMADVRIQVPCEQHGLKKQEAGGPNCRTAAKAWQKLFSDQRLDLEQQKRTDKDRSGERNGEPICARGSLHGHSW
jgi:hypothetical protein